MGILTIEADFKTINSYKVTGSPQYSVSLLETMVILYGVLYSSSLFCSSPPNNIHYSHFFPKENKNRKSIGKINNQDDCLHNFTYIK